MNDQTDSQLLHAYAKQRSEPAFAELVRRHVDFVYSAALRMVCDSHLAQDVTQGVFVALSKNAAQLVDRPVLSGWLHRTAQNIAAQTVRTDVRRRARESEAATMNEISSAEADASWEHVAPHLDAALGELSEADRDALLLRYFERKSAREMAQVLGGSENAAQKRVNRAVEKLREFFSNQKITIGAGGLVVLISANAVQAAPVGLAAAISAAITLTTKTLGMTMIHKLLITAMAAVAVGTGIYAFHLQSQMSSLQQQQTSLAAQVEQLSHERDDAKNQLAGLQQENKQLRGNEDELLKLRGETGVLRRQLGELAEKNRAFQNHNVATSGSNTNPPTPQIHIKARFLTMPKDVLSGLGGATSFNGILTSENFSIALEQLRSRNGVETLAEPEVVLTSGRQVQMRATQIISVVTNFCLQETNGTSSIVPQTENVETGPVLDAIPRVLPDGYTIELPVSASVVEFLGYAQSTNTTPAYNSAGQEIDVPTVSPHFVCNQTTNSVNLFDDQTLVFGLKDNQVQTDPALTELDGSKSNSLNRHTLVFVTATIIDPAGNRVHEDASYTNIPPQQVNQ